MARAKARARKVTRPRIRSRYPNLSNSKDTAGTARIGDKRADCRKRIADGKSKGGAAAVSADNDGVVAAVMEVDDAVMGTGDDETSTGWCFAVASVWDQRVLSSWTAEVMNTCAHRSLQT